LGDKLGEKLQRFAQNPSDRELKQYLFAWAKTLHKDSKRQAKIHDIAPQITREIEGLRQKPKREISLER
jgi:hypothetical protein